MLHKRFPTGSAVDKLSLFLDGGAAASFLTMKEAMVFLSFGYYYAPRS